MMMNNNIFTNKKMKDMSLTNYMHYHTLTRVIILSAILPLLTETAIEIQHISLRQERGVGDNCIVVPDDYTKGIRKCCDRKHAFISNLNY